MCYKLLRLLDAMCRRDGRPTTVGGIARNAASTWRRPPSTDTVRAALSQLLDDGVVVRRLETPDEAWHRARHDTRRRTGQVTTQRRQYRYFPAPPPNRT